MSCEPLGLIIIIKFVMSSYLTFPFFVCITARHFLTRALLTARNFAEAETILRDHGAGSAHGFNVNMAFLHQVLTISRDDCNQSEHN